LSLSCDDYVEVDILGARQSPRAFLEQARNERLASWGGQRMTFKIANIKAALLGMGMLMLGSSAQAGNLTFALDSGVYYNFSVAPAVYYSQILAPNFGVNAFINGKYTFVDPGIRSAGLGASLNYAIPIVRDNQSFFEGFANLGFSYDIFANQGDPFIGAGVRGSLKIEPNARVFAATTLQLPWDTYRGQLRTNLNGYVGAQVDLMPNLETTAQVDYTYRFNPVNVSRPFTFNARAIVFYTFMPDFKVGGFAGYNTSDQWYVTLGLRYSIRV
jgi:hypothetical protein